MKTLALLIIVLFGSKAIAADKKMIRLETLMYPSTGIENYLQPYDLLHNHEADKACPNGITKISNISVKIDATFKVVEGRGQAQTYPRIVQQALVTCN